MSNTSAQLETVFQEITEHFADISQITVVPEEGNPPEQYRITYHIAGVCKEAGGEVTPCNTHIVTISLPFGFPHFPPNCRPESPLFHPDFDSSAICIGDAWDKDKSIVKLILHIGKLISGESYSTVNAFNEEAAKWYQAHRDQLPFDKTFDSDILGSKPQSPPATPPGPPPSPEPIFPPNTESLHDVEEIDMLGDDMFGHSFSLEEDDTIPTADIPAPASAIDTDRLRVIAKQKRFQALSRELASIKGTFEGREQLESQMQQAMANATSLFKEADTLEHHGNQQQAMDKYLAVEGLVADYPLLQEAKERVKQSLDLLGDWVTNGAKAAPQDAKTTDTNKEKGPAGTAASGKRTFFEEKKATGKKWLLYALGGGCIAICATLAVSYMSLSSGLEKAEQSYSECDTLLKEWKFEPAEQKCDEALDLLASVRIIKQGDKEELEKDIRALLASELLRQGLQGNTLLDGKYVSKSIRELLLAFKTAKTNGDSFYEKGTWQEAVLNYESALKTADKTDQIDTKLVADIRQKLPRARFNFLMEIGEKSLSSSDWDAASKYFSEALQLAKADPNVPLEDIVQLELLSNQTTFNTLRDKGHAAFKEKNWLVALDSYQAALKLEEKLNLQESDTIASLYENIAKTKIYMTVEKGKEAFADARWDEAIKQYAQATLLLEENSKLLSQINTEDSREKLSRIMLHASIIRDKQDVAKFLKVEDHEPALEKLRNIQHSITASSFADQAEFKTLLQEVDEQIEESEKKLIVIQQTTYLTENFEELFLKHYPTAKHSKLSAPKVEFLKKLNGKLLFRMQCTETAGGRPLRLQMDYLYSPAKDSWQFYSEE